MGAFLLLALILLASDLLFARARSRAASSSRRFSGRDKVARLWAERQSQIVGLVNKYTNRGSSTTRPRVRMAFSR